MGSYRYDRLGERKAKVLMAIIHEYIDRAEPVSSRTIATKYSIGLSPASIRNIMAELEKEGYLASLHVSSGRIPTDRGFRLYVNSLCEFEEPEERIKNLIRSCFKRFITSDELIRKLTRTLSSVTHCTGFVFTYSKTALTIKSIRFVHVGDSGILVVIVASDNTVHTKLIRLNEELHPSDIERISNYINSMAEGLTIKELRMKVAEEMKKEKNLYDRLLSRALKLGALATKELSSALENIYMDGKINILEQPEFREDAEKIKRLVGAFEEKRLLLKILDKSIDEGPHIFIGSEFDIEEFAGLSFVTAPYGREGLRFGTIGVIGPVRMNYPRIIPLVDYAADFLGKSL